MRRLDDFLRGQIENPPSPDAIANSLDVDPEEAARCLLCGGAGFVRHDLPLGHPDFGRAFPCRCVLNEEKHERQERLVRYSHLGPLRDVTFAMLEARAGEGLRRAIGQAQQFASAHRGWLVLAGPSGSGKTRLAAAIANYSIAEGQPALFVVVPDFLDHLRSAYMPDAELPYDVLFKQVCEAPMLVLDELGVQSPTPWAQEKLFQIINQRYLNRLPTVVTLAAPLDGLDDRLRTRLSDEELSQVLLLERDGPRNGSNVLSLAKLRKMTFATFLHSGNELRQKVLAGFTNTDPDLNGSALQDRVERTMQSLRLAHSNAKGYAENPDGWLVLIGETGRGKTHLAAAIAHNWQEKGLTVLFCVVPDLLEDLRSGYRDDHSAAPFDKSFERIRAAEYLILDDLGVHSATAWAQEKLFQILNYRYNAKLPTVITIGCSLDALPEAWVSRMYDPEVSMIFEVQAPDFRASLPRRVENKRGRRPGGPGGH